MTLKAERSYHVQQDHKYKREFSFSLPFDRPIFYVSFLIGIVLIVCAVWFLFKGDDTSSEVEIRVVKADEDPYKIKVEESAVNSIPFQDKLVYNRIHPSGPIDPSAEHLLPEPEAPIKLEAVEEKITPDLRGQNDMSKEEDVIQVAISNPPSMEVESDPISKIVIEQEVQMETAAEPTESKETEAVASIDDLLSGVVDEGNSSSPAQPDGIYVQLATIDDEAQANSEWKRFKRMATEVLEKKNPIIQQVSLEDRGNVYRLRVGPYDSVDAAKSDCKKLKEKKVGCIVIR